MVSLEKPFGEGFSNGDERNRSMQKGKEKKCIGKWTKYERFRVGGTSILWRTSNKETSAPQARVCGVQWPAANASRCGAFKEAENALCWKPKARAPSLEHELEVLLLNFERMAAAISIEVHRQRIWA